MQTFECMAQHRVANTSNGKAVTKRPMISLDGLRNNNQVALQLINRRAYHLSKIYILYINTNPNSVLQLQFVNNLFIFYLARACNQS